MRFPNLVMPVPFSPMILSAQVELRDLKLLYNKGGIDAANVTDGYSSTDTANFFTRDIGNKKTEYLILLNDNYFCEYFVDNSLADKVSVSEQLKSFCLELDNIIATDKDKS